MRTALDTGNRRRIVGTQLGDTATPSLRYSALWSDGTDGCIWWPRCTEDELRAKIGELWPSMRLRQMTGDRRALGDNASGSGSRLRGRERDPLLLPVERGHPSAGVVGELL
jgi:hypothetical protein